MDKAGKLSIIQAQVANSGSSPMSESCGKLGVGSVPQWACVCQWWIKNSCRANEHWP